MFSFCEMVPQYSNNLCLNLYIRNVIKHKSYRNYTYFLTFSIIFLILLFLNIFRNFFVVARHYQKNLVWFILCRLFRCFTSSAYWIIKKVLFLLFFQFLSQLRTISLTITSKLYFQLIHPFNILFFFIFFWKKTCPL